MAFTRGRTPVVNPADGTGVIKVFKPLPPQNHRDGIELRKMKINAYAEERAIPNEYRPPLIRGRSPAANKSFQRAPSPASSCSSSSLVIRAQPMPTPRGRTPTTHVDRGRTPIASFNRVRSQDIARGRTPTNSRAPYDSIIKKKTTQSMSTRRVHYADESDKYSYTVKRSQSLYPQDRSSHHQWTYQQQRNTTQKYSRRSVNPESVMPTTPSSRSSSMAPKKRPHYEDYETPRRGRGRPRKSAAPSTATGPSAAAGRRSHKLTENRAHADVSMESVVAKKSTDKTASSVEDYARYLLRVQKHWSRMNEKTSAIRQIQSEIHKKLNHLEYFVEKQRRDQEQHTEMQRKREEQLQEQRQVQAMLENEKKNRVLCGIKRENVGDSRQRMTLTRELAPMMQDNRNDRSDADSSFANTSFSGGSCGQGTALKRPHDRVAFAGWSSHSSGNHIGHKDSGGHKKPIWETTIPKSLDSSILEDLKKELL